MKNKMKQLGSRVLVLCAVMSAVAAQAQSDATVVATNAQTAFQTIAPITIAIVGFYVILKLAKRTVK